ncbi:hypothetical protein Mapa_014183 [Marchantia paleacea]|nr:hypothetical protein Mapa_014183 [Marchantia paleacea]
MSEIDIAIWASGKDEIAHRERNKQKNNNRKKKKNKKNRVAGSFDTSPTPAAAPLPDLLYAPRMNRCSSFPAAAILWAHHLHKHQALAGLPACCCSSSECGATSEEAGEAPEIQRLQHLFLPRVLDPWLRWAGVGKQEEEEQQ